MKKPTSAGLLISETSDYSVELCRGAFEASKEKGLDFTLFFGGSIDSHVNYDVSSDYQRTVVYEFVNILDVNYLLVPVTSICRTDKELRKKFIDYFKCPLITLNSESEGYSFVRYDNKKGVQDAVSYLIEKCHCQNVALITAYKEGITTKQRLEGYKLALKKYKRELNENHILFAPGYSQDSQKKIKQWLQENTDIDGIMCVTDDIAYNVYSVLEEMGKEVGKDIMVAGFDDLPKSIHMNPPLSSCHVDASFLGYLGIINGLDLYHNNNFSHQLLDAHFIPRLSVNFDSKNINEIKEFVEYCRSVKESNEYIAQGMTQYIFDDRLLYGVQVQDDVAHFFEYLLNLSVEQCTDHNVYNDISHYIDHIFQEDHLRYVDLERMFYCLSFLLNTENYSKSEDKCKVEVFKQFVYSKMINSYNYLLIQKERNNEMRMKMISFVNKKMMVDVTSQIFSSIEESIIKLGIKNAQLYIYSHPILSYEFRAIDIPDEMYLKVNVQDGIPQKIIQEEIKTADLLNHFPTHSRVMTTIYFNENQYGVLLADVSFYDLSVLRYLSNQIGIAIYQYLLIEEINSLSVTDELTAIYNRRGFIQGTQKLYNEAMKKNKNIFLLLGDLDHLKYINDTFGHEYGDKALKLVSHVLRSLFYKKAVVGRIGGDEFAVSFICDDASFIANIDELLNEKLDLFNNQKDYPFDASLSYGISAFAFDMPYDLNHVISLADALMYERKKKRHQQEK